MDKDNRDDFTFAKLSDLKLPLTLRMYALILAGVPTTHSQPIPDPVHNLKEQGHETQSRMYWRTQN
jgi:phosphatidylinositol 3-kinase